MNNASTPYHSAGYVASDNPDGPKITLSLDVSPAEYAALKENEIFFTVTIDEDGNLDIEKIGSDFYPQLSAE
jgi:hypothetical protein